MNEKFGVQKELITHIRDYDYETVCGAAEDKYPEVYEIPRENTGTLKNQGTVGACVAEVISQIAENWYTSQGESGEMSEGFVYATLRPESSTGEGMVVSEAMKFWTSIGTLPKKYFDILDEMPEIKKIVSKFPEFRDIASKYKLKGFVSLNYGDKTRRDNAIKSALTKYEYGLVAVSHEYFGESHCIQLTGWNDKTDKYKFKNSWGELYGDKGFSEIPKNKINYVYLPLFEEIKLPFEDVKESDWYYNDVKNMSFAGIIKGKTDKTFEPDAPITRAEVTALINRVLKETDTRFDIVNKVFIEKYGK